MKLLFFFLHFLVKTSIVSRHSSRNLFYFSLFTAYITVRVCRWVPKALLKRALHVKTTMPNGQHADVYLETDANYTKIKLCLSSVPVKLIF